MTGTDLCVNKCKQSRSYLNHLVYYFSTSFPAMQHINTRRVLFVELKKTQ